MADRVVLPWSHEDEDRRIENLRQDAYNRGWDDALAALWSEPVCSVCGSNHDRDESAACDGCEVVTFREWVDATGPGAERDE